MGRNLKTVTSDQLRKLIKQSGAGGFLGRGTRLFDREYALFSISEIDARVQAAISSLFDDGITDQSYADNGADCDNFALLIQAEVMKAWMLENKGKTSYPAIAFGSGIMPKHSVNVGICEDGVRIWNYGTLTDWNPSELFEVEIR